MWLLNACLDVPKRRFFRSGCIQTRLKFHLLRTLSWIGLSEQPIVDFQNISILCYCGGRWVVAASDFLMANDFLRRSRVFFNIAASNGENIAVMNASNEKKLKRMKMRKKQKKKTSQKSGLFSTLLSWVPAMENRTMKRRKMRKKRKKTKSLTSCFSLTRILLPASL